MAKAALQPFKNESDTLQIGDLMIENRLDRVSIFGSLDITLDQEGLKDATELKALLDYVLEAMGHCDLPEKISVVQPETVKNPFA